MHPPPPPSAPPPRRSGAGSSPPPQADPDLDRLATVAARLLGAARVLVSAADGERQVVRGQHGLGERGGRGEEVSLCREVMASGEPLLVPDAAADPRFAGHPAVVGGGVGAYVGVPLQGGGALGAVAHEPRVWGGDDLHALRDLAALAERLLAERPARTERLRTIFDAAFQFMGLMALDGTVLEVNRPALDFAGAEPGDVVGRPVWEGPWWRHSAAGREALRAAVEQAAAGALVRYEDEVCGADGTCVAIDLSIKPVVEGGEVVLLIPEGRPLSEEVRALHMQEALQAGMTGTWTIDFAADAVTCFGGTNAIFGLPPCAEPRPVSDYLSRVHPDDDRALRFAIAQAAGRGKPFNVQFRVLRPGGADRHVSAYGEADLDAAGALARITGALTDVTERDATEAALRRAEELSEVALAAAGMGTWAWDLATDHVELDARERHLLGLDPDAPVTVADVFRQAHPEDLPALQAALQRAKDSQADYEHEFRVRRTDGGYRWVAGKGRLLSGPTGQAGWLVGVNFDVTEQRLAREALRESEGRFRRLAEASPQIVFIAGPDGAIEYLNDRWYAYTGQRREPAVMPDLWGGLHPEDRHVLDGVWAEARAQEQPLDMEARLRGAGGGYRWFLFRSVPLQDEGAAATQWLGTATDIDLQKTIEATLERRVAARTAELNRSNQELDQFAYVASHDLKAPLRGIANLATWIEEDVGEALPEGSRRHLDLLLGRVQRMERLLDDLLAYSRIGRAETSPEPVDTAALIRDVAEIIAPPAAFTIRIEGEMPEIVTPCPPLETVFRNLLHNAVKHHHRADGTAVVSASDAGGGFVAFTVTDDGPGIPPEYHERVFGLFQTLRPRDEVEGSGMGLAYVRKTVESLGGTVRLASEPGRGAAFRFTWPASPPPNPEP